MKESARINSSPPAVSLHLEFSSDARNRAKSDLSASHEALVAQTVLSAVSPTGSRLADLFRGTFKIHTAVPTTGSHRCTRAFTLIELLVVIAIIAILAPLLLPVN